MGITTWMWGNRHDFGNFLGKCVDLLLKHHLTPAIEAVDFTEPGDVPVESSAGGNLSASGNVTGILRTHPQLWPLTGVNGVRTPTTKAGDHYKPGTVFGASSCIEQPMNHDQIHTIPILIPTKTPFSVTP